MEYEIKNCGVKDVDLVVKEVINILEKYGKYVLVSGYISIFCCRTRPTQDIDVIFLPFSDNHIKQLLEELEKRGYETHYDEEGWKKHKDPFYIYTDLEIGDYKLYFEIKQPKDEYSYSALTNRIIIKKRRIQFFFSPIELQIAYKFWLGSDKDILDAYYLLNLFGELLNKNILLDYAKRLGVEDELEKAKSSSA